MSNRRANVLFVAAGAFVVLRWVWEAISPLHFDTVKSWIYVRDVLTIGPASLLALGGVLSLRPRAARWIDEPRRRVPWLIAAATTVACFLVATFVLLGTPAVVDEAAYLWQGQLIAHGHLASAVPPAPSATIIEYIGDVGNKRVSVFFPGSSLPLAVGHALGAVTLVDPLLAGLLMVITYWAGRRLFSARVGVIGAALMALSPFVIFQGASFFGQVWTGLLVVPAVTMALAQRRRYEPVGVGFLLAAALFSRPVSAAVAGLAVAVAWALTGGRRAWIGRAVQAVVGAAVPVFGFCAMNRDLTGNWLQTAHRLLLPNESAIFGLHAVKNALLNIVGLAVDFNGFVVLALCLLFPALWSRSKPACFIVGYGAVHLSAYSLYYNHGISYGPRYLFELTPLLALVAAHGLTQVRRLDERVPALLLTGIVLSVVGIVPARAAQFHDRAAYLDLAPVENVVTKSTQQPSLVLMSRGPYAFPDPFYPAFVHNGEKPGGTKITYVRDDAANRCALLSAYPGRVVFVVDMDAKARGAAPTEYVTAQNPC